MQEIKYVNINEIKPDPNNPRLIKDDQFKKLCKSIKDNKEYFETRPILCDKNMVIFAGNMRYKAAKELGLKEVPVSIFDISEEKRNELMIRDNVSNGEWDFDILANQFEADELQFFGVDFVKLSEDKINDAMKPDPLEKFEDNLSDSAMERGRVIIAYQNSDERELLEEMLCVKLNKVVYSVGELGKST